MDGEGGVGEHVGGAVMLDGEPAAIAAADELCDDLAGGDDALADGRGGAVVGGEAVLEVDVVDAVAEVGEGGQPSFWIVRLLHTLKSLTR